MKKFAIDSFVVLLAVGMGFVVGYVTGWAQYDELRRHAEVRGFLRNGTWIDLTVPEEEIRLEKPSRR